MANKVRSFVPLREGLDVRPLPFSNLRTADRPSPPHSLLRVRGTDTDPLLGVVLRGQQICSDYLGYHPLTGQGIHQQAIDVPMYGVHAMSPSQTNSTVYSTDLNFLETPRTHDAIFQRLLATNLGHVGLYQHMFRTLNKIAKILRV